ncbi:MAG: TIGR04086 family membrane protein [Lachnospiraceae bacterium]|nr:TIGR04086 family membrane protein [Lachnospiraceae bacterium]
MDKMTNPGSKAISVMKSVLFSYLVTIFMLLVIAFLMLQTGLSGGVLGAMVIVTYIVSVFLGSFYMGRHVEQKRFVWGLIVGVVYFAIYCMISMIVHGEEPAEVMHFVKAFLIIAGSGMLGGMLS